MPAHCVCVMPCRHQRPVAIYICVISSRSQECGESGAGMEAPAVRLKNNSRTLKRALCILLKSWCYTQLHCDSCSEGMRGGASEDNAAAMRLTAMRHRPRLQEVRAWTGSMVNLSSHVALPPPQWCAHALTVTGTVTGHTAIHSLRGVHDM